MGIFDRIYRIAKAEINDRLNKSGLSFEHDATPGDLEEELRILEEELRRGEQEREQRRRRFEGESDSNPRARGSRDSHARRQDSPNVYEVLGVSPRASQDELKDRFRDLAKKYHPDRIQRLSPAMQESAKQKMKEINQAYTQINNPTKRREYDLRIGLS
jgi:DnaJ-domain-containing protein 1